MTILAFPKLGRVVLTQGLPPVVARFRMRLEIITIYCMENFMCHNSITPRRKKCRKTNSRNIMR